MHGQQVVPGTGIRIIVSAVWEAPDRPCTIRATLDTPTDEFTSQIRGFDTEGLFTVDELGDAMALLLLNLIDDLR